MRIPPLSLYSIKLSLFLKKELSYLHFANMGTSLLLRSHDCLQDRDALPITSSSIRSQRNPNPNPNPYQNRRRRLYDCDRMVVKAPDANLVMGQVKILKRGEKLSPENTSSSDDGFDLVLGSTIRLGPDPSSVPVPEFLALRRWWWWIGRFERWLSARDTSREDWLLGSFVIIWSDCMVSTREWLDLFCSESMILGCKAMKIKSEAKGESFWSREAFRSHLKTKKKKKKRGFCEEIVFLRVWGGGGDNI